MNWIAVIFLKHFGCKTRNVVCSVENQIMRFSFNSHFVTNFRCKSKHEIAMNEDNLYYFSAQF